VAELEVSVRVGKLNWWGPKQKLLVFYRLYSSAFQPVRRYELVRMRKPCGADDEHVPDECGW